MSLFDCLHYSLLPSLPNPHCRSTPGALEGQSRWLRVQWALLCSCMHCSPILHSGIAAPPRPPHWYPHIPPTCAYLPASTEQACFAYVLSVFLLSRFARQSQPRVVTTEHEQGPLVYFDALLHDVTPGSPTGLPAAQPMYRWGGCEGASWGGNVCGMGQPKC